MQETLEAIVVEAREGAQALETRPDFEAFKARFVGPKGQLTLVSKGMGKVPREERPILGKKINETKQALEAILGETLERIEAAEQAARLGPPVDPSLPCPEPAGGQRHPLSLMRQRFVSAFRKVGYTVAEGPAIDTDWFCFDALNTPEDHPARDAQDTLYLPPALKMGNVAKRADEPYLLRTHTSTVQIRTMLAEKPPLRIISPGLAFRRDTVDATHSANFHQVEGLCVDREVSVVDLKAILDFLVHELIGPEVQTRLRPSFFPFTEPSFELDIRSPNLGKLSNRWIEMGGCGMVDPNVFEAVGYDPDQWRGFAFGMGLERLSMLLYAIDDIRYFYANDLRFLRQFG